MGNGAPPPLPAGGGGGAGGAGGGGAAAPCKWEILVKVHSQERFWPKKDFNVQIADVNADSTLGAVVDSSTVTMVAKDSPQSRFCGQGAKTFGVTATAPAIQEEKDWILAKGKTSKDPLPNSYVSVSVSNGNLGKHAKKVDLYIRHPLKVNLQLKFKDPAKRVLLFPKDFPVQVYNKNKLGAYKTDEAGKVSFEIDRKYDWVTLKFGGNKVFVANGDSSTEKTELKAWADRDALKKDNYFGSSKSWALIESIWEFSEEPKYIDGAAAYKKDEGKIYLFDPPTKNWVRRIGESETPVVLTLDPNWQFVRLEYFDRYYGHSDHGHERVNTPPILVEGFYGEKKMAAEDYGHWTLNKDSVSDCVHAVPWIRQKDAKGNKTEKPSKKCLLMVETAAGTYSLSTDKNARELQILKSSVKADADRLKASADRLKLYDLPQTWKSAKYFTRFKKGAGYEGKFYEDWDDADHAKSKDQAKPLIFSLDDVILSNSSDQPLKMKKDEKITVFYHRFKKAYNEAANLSPEGIYKPDAVEAYYSNLKLEGADYNYLTEYPNWVRLVAGITALFDVFDHRTKKGVYGARAGVRWYNPQASGTAAGKNIGYPAAVVKPYFVLQPYYGQLHHETWSQYKNANSPSFRIGRFDLALLRCCDRDDVKEIFIDMEYFRLRYNFDAASIHAGNAGAQKNFMRTSFQALMNRWNGNDAVSNDRVEFIPQDNTKKLQGECVYFIHPAANDKDAHFRMKVYNAVALGQRAWMNSTNGTGEVDDNDNAPDQTWAQNSFTLAHEFGHGGSLPDEYYERANWNSQGVAGILCNIPGDPFVDEGVFFDTSNSFYGAAYVPGNAAATTALFPLMNHQVDRRNRHLWHAAEFSRKYIGEKFFVKIGAAYPDYRVPGHPKYPKQSYVYWPANSAVNYTRGTRGKMDAYLHVAGKDRYTVTLLPNQYGGGNPFEGFLTVLLKVKLTASATLNAKAVRNLVRNAILPLNGTLYATGDLDVKTDKGTEVVNMAKCYFRVTPRFLMTNVPAGAAAAKYNANTTWLQNNVGTHFDVQVTDKAGGGASGYAPKNARHLDLVVDVAGDPNVVNTLTGLINQYVFEMLGVPAGNAANAGNLKEIAQKVFTKNGDVH
jgi:hypothetical protein